MITLLEGSPPDTPAIAGDGFSPVPAMAASHGPKISFFETAFEWEHMTYETLPYYWARHDQWDALLSIDDPDPEHRRFLQAGAARALIPVRPDHEWYVAGVLTAIVLHGGTIAPSLFEPSRGRP